MSFMPARVFGLMIGAVLVLAEPGVARTEKIIGGSEVGASHRLAKSVAALINVVEPEPDEAFEVCTASFLSNRVLLTAAHCLPELEAGQEPEALYVKIGVDAYDEGQRLKVDRVLAHPDYNEATYISDVAVIRLAESYSGAKPLPLVRPQDLRGSSSSRLGRVQAVGFGRSNSGRAYADGGLAVDRLFVGLNERRIANPSGYESRSWILRRRFGWSGALKTGSRTRRNCGSRFHIRKSRPQRLQSVRLLYKRLASSRMDQGRDARNCEVAITRLGLIQFQIVEFGKFQHSH